MAQSSRSAAPVVSASSAASEKMPAGIPYIIGNEAAERFSFYGMKAILVVFMTQYLMGPGGQLSLMGEKEATGYYHLFTMAVYALPLLGAIISDGFWGKYRTIMVLSLVYCAGHLALALDDTRVGLLVGLGLIALGSGGIKPCVSANVGDQFTARNQGLLQKVFGWFYFSINFGAFGSSLLTPYLLNRYGPSWAFGIPGVLMLLATAVFWLGRNKFVRVPAGGMSFVKETFSKEGLAAIGKLFVIYFFVAVFWSLYDQTGSSWVLQAQKMDRNFLGVEWLSSQVQAVNPILVMLLIPVFTYGVYPLVNKVFPLTSLRKIGIGMFVCFAAFAITAMAETQIAAGLKPSIGWQLAAYLVITCAEVMVSITCLEFSYTQAPPKMKSLVMSLYLMSVSLGNLFTSGVNFFIQNADGTSKLEGPAYFWFFAWIMLGAAILYIPVARRFKEKSYVQGDTGAVQETSSPQPKVAVA